MDGVINVYKEKGFTSHDVVAIIRRLCKMKKVGHTGTLDPQAEGVLPICIGRATKISAAITDKEKSYRAELLLGKTTDTGDHTGKTLTTSNVNTTRGELDEAISPFIGGYEQIPPMYSALKINGKRLYQLAREGKTVERKPRFVNITSIDIVQVTEADGIIQKAILDVDCGKGTYIRSLCEDIGEKLGCGGCMGDLVRTKSGPFTVDAAFYLSQLEQMIKENRWDFLISPEGILNEL